MDAKKMLAASFRKLRGRKPRAVRRAEGLYVGAITRRWRTGKPEGFPEVKVGRPLGRDLLKGPPGHVVFSPSGALPIPPTVRELSAMTVPVLHALYFERTGVKLPTKMRKAEILLAFKTLDSER